MLTQRCLSSVAFPTFLMATIEFPYNLASSSPHSFSFLRMRFLVHLRPRNLYLNVVVFGLEGLLLFRNFGQMRKEQIVLSHQPRVLSFIDFELVAGIELGEFVEGGQEGLRRGYNGDWVEGLENIFVCLLLGHL